MKKKVEKKGAAFRGLDAEFMKALMSGKLRPLVDFEHAKHAKGDALIVEIRDNYLTLYFLGHSVNVVRRGKTGRYVLCADKTFDPSDLLGKNKKIVTRTNSGWEISFEDIHGPGDFEQVMKAVIGKIVMHKHGNISEGVSELNHFIDNRAGSKNGILVIDRQVAYPGLRENRIDLLGLKRLPSGKSTFAVIELKNKNNPQIPEVFSQVRRYIDGVYRKDVYENFRETYSKILKQKSELGFLVKFGAPIAAFSEISKKDLAGIVVLDNLNMRTEIREEGLLSRALRDWDNLPNGEYNISLFLKSNVLDGTLALDREQAGMCLEEYKKCNS